MSVEWAGWGPELLLTIDRDSGVGLRSQLEAQLRDAIRSGRLAGDERLPSSRVLARVLGLSRGLVQDCYAQLQAEGYLTSRPGAPTRVAADAAPVRDAPSRPSPPSVPRQVIADFRHGVPDLGLAPREDWAWAIREVCRTAPNTAFDYGDPIGEQRLREVLAGYLRRVRAVAATSDHVVVCSGMAQALGLVLKVLAAEGVDTLAFEDPGAGNSTTEQATAAGMAVVPIPVDEDGLDVAALERSGARAVLVTPAHQWPTGVVLAGHRRQELIAWARRCDGVIIEDDYDAEFRYDREPVGSLQGLAPDCVVSLGTVSKSLAPALRLGWLVAPDRLLAALARAKFIADRGSPGLDQLALATLIESGRYDRHLRRARAEYAARRETLLTALAEHAPDLRVTGLAAGFHAVLHLPPGTDEDQLIEQARQRGVELYGMATMRRLPATEGPQLVLGFGDTPRRAIEAGIATIADLLGR
ncbi:GntR family transcriptional regulator/MocR family aminotransferase [Kibdelosporangium banguiense]|uniref:GntR family transcriptional regulator/MocR family aminotransferase n=1 Tax=Kibdelosporangium banguiense TaxID=1365924 RepID=A0ABS4U2P9_9PSEU|nr:PLP-dependent aminotransferase family protein [Kibdelosporangium banguiense]MBP2330470.1 GntR family transcriptional regulator/MocR family aminotransferase [Kibdelosporangium banguiense]